MTAFCAIECPPLLESAEAAACSVKESAELAALSVTSRTPASIDNAVPNDLFWTSNDAMVCRMVSFVGSTFTARCAVSIAPAVLF